MKTVRRRTFLKLTAAGGAAALIGGALAPDFRQAVHKVLQSVHPTLQVSTEVSDAFFEEADAQQLWEQLHIRTKEKWILMAYTIVPAASYLPYAAYYEKLKQRIVKSFLPATSFFQNGMDTTRPLQYTGLYNPFKKPCGHPFSTLYYPG